MDDTQPATILPFHLTRAPSETVRSKRVLDRAARQRKLQRLKIAVAVAGLAGTGIFSGLAIANTHTAAPHAVSPDQQLSSLEHNQGGGFFSSGGVAPPPASSGPAQTSSGGS